jgi:hypothetical protein
MPRTANPKSTDHTILKGISFLITALLFLWLPLCHRVPFSALVRGCVLTLFFFSVGQAFELQPLAVRNLSPAVIGFGLPTLNSAQILPAGQGRAELAQDLVSNFVDDSQNSEQLLLDGETWRSNLSLNYAPSAGLELGISLPYIHHQAGFLDGFIEGWHQAFGLPQGGRDQAPRERLMYSYQADSGSQFKLDSSAGGWGDLSLHAAWQLWQDSPSGRALALRGALKLPTGSAARLTGSGSTDFALWLSAGQRISATAGSWLIYGGGGALWGSKGDLLQNQRRQLVGLASLGLGWQPFDTLGMQIQFDGHSAFYHSSQTALGRFAGLLSMGGSLALGENTRLELAVSEDVLVGTTSDVGFHLSLSRIF